MGGGNKMKKQPKAIHHATKKYINAVEKQKQKEKQKNTETEKFKQILERVETLQAAAAPLKQELMIHFKNYNLKDIKTTSKEIRLFFIDETLNRDLINKIIEINLNFCIDILNSYSFYIVYQIPHTGGGVDDV